MNLPVTMLRNTSSVEGRHWAKFRLRGTAHNTDGIGAVIEITAGGVTQRVPVMRCSSFLGSNDPRIHVGLGAHATCDVKVIWPDRERSTTTYAGLGADKLLAARRRRIACGGQAAAKRAVAI